MIDAARAALMRHLSGYWYAQTLSVAARLGVADALADGALGIADLAARCGAHEAALLRLMRALAAVGVFAEQRDDRFALTPTSELLRSDVEGSLGPVAALGGLPFHWRAWGGLYDAVRKGETAFDRVHGRPLFDYLDAHPEEARTFHRVMRGPPSWQRAVVDAVDVTGIGTLADVGGGDGTLLKELLARHPHLRGVVFDRPSVIDEASAAGPPDPRLRWEGGDFLERIPLRVEGCLLRFVLHDWPDEQAARILRNCREALLPGGRVLVVEHLMGRERNAATALLDVAMLVLTGGRERTEPEIATLFDAAGLRLERVRPTAAGVFVIEGVPAS